jgi:hypothetical protein
MIGKELHRGFEKEDVASLIEAHDWLSGLADRDCDCGWNPEDSQVDRPCETCQARRAMDALNRVIDPTPRTLHPARLKNDAERIYFDLWCHKNKRFRALNGGHTLVEHLLTRERTTAGITSMEPPKPVSQHDMTIATSVIQWLGTNGGRCFMEEAEKEIEKRRAERRTFGTDGLSQPPEGWADRDRHGPLWSAADSIAATFVSVEKHPSVYRALQNAIHSALCKAAAGQLPSEGVESNA